MHVHASLPLCSRCLAANTIHTHIHLYPPPHKIRNIAKLLEKDKQVLRFAARIVQSSGRSVAPADAPRRFVISYFLADDTVSVFEPPIRNSGIIGGRFYERSAVKGVTDQQLFVGGHLCILQRYDVFVLDVAYMMCMCVQYGGKSPHIICICSNAT